jgi:ABC-type multidrug transport system ATPase subunit
VKLAAHLGTKKSGHTLYLFDEPTTGLHMDDIRKLLDAFQALVAAGHSVILIEHNLDVIKCADWVIDIGPEGGRRGGFVVAEGIPEEVAAHPTSHTGRFLRPLLGMAAEIGEGERESGREGEGKPVAAEQPVAAAATPKTKAAKSKSPAGKPKTPAAKAKTPAAKSKSPAAKAKKPPKAS